MLTLQNPRARARLRLNVKGFNMGENAPWLTLIEGSDSGRPSRSTLKSFGHPWRRIVSAVFPGPEALRASSADRHHQFGTPVFSPWHDPGEPSGISTRLPRRLNPLRVLYQHFRATKLTVVPIGQDREYAQNKTTTQLAQPQNLRLCDFADWYDRRARKRRAARVVGAFFGMRNAVDNPTALRQARALSWRRATTRGD
jgi:hypothetical protein